MERDGQNDRFRSSLGGFWGMKNLWVIENAHAGTFTMRVLLPMRSFDGAPLLDHLSYKWGSILPKIPMP